MTFFILELEKNMEEGSFRGRSKYFCISFNGLIRTWDIEYNVLKQEKTDFAKMYIKYNTIEKFVETAKIFKKQCPDKMNFEKAENLLKKYQEDVNTKNAVLYLKTACPKIKDEGLRRSCLETGEKGRSIL